MYLVVLKLICGDDAVKKPENYELKKWLCENTIVGLELYNYQTGTDTAATDWELIPQDGKKKRVKSHSVEGLVTVRPDWIRVLSVTDIVAREVDEYKVFAKKEAKDLREYERLQKKFS